MTNKEIISESFLKPYFSGEKKHAAYDKTVEIMNRLKTHANGEHPAYQNDTKDETMTDVITSTRPNEGEKVKDFRTKIFVPITKSVVSRVFSSLNKIRKSKDWNIKYDKENESAKFTKGETLYNYCEENYPYFNSVTNWMFNAGIKHYGIDSNGVVAVIPLEFKVEDGKFPRPYNYIFDSSQVYDYVENEYAILYSNEKSEYTVEGGKTFYDGKVFFVITKEYYYRYEQVNAKGDMEVKPENILKHDLGELPVFKNKGIYYKSINKIFVWESRLDSMVPRLTEAAREYSDRQGCFLNHVNPEKWIWLSQECKECSGTGSVIRGKNSVKCTKCKGEGKLISSPYQHGTVRAGMPGETPAPWPPATYLLKPVDSLQLLIESIKEHLYEALSSINMQWMMQLPLSAASGVAKEVDRDELNNFINGFAEDVIWIMDRTYYFNNELRNKVRIPDQKERLDQLPVIACPDSYNIIAVETSLDMIIKGRTNNLSPQLVTAMELEFAQKQFNSDPEIKKRLALYFSLDPLPGISDDVKLTRLTGGGITKTDYIISCNLEQFIQAASIEKKGFLELGILEQKKIISEYAKKKEKELSAKESVMKIIDDKNKDEEDQKNKSA